MKGDLPPGRGRRRVSTSEPGSLAPCLHVVLASTRPPSGAGTDGDWPPPVPLGPGGKGRTWQHLGLAAPWRAAPWRAAPWRAAP
eukprot:122573-Chlamydomonas_euryale.AAC.5